MKHPIYYTFHVLSPWGALCSQLLRTLLHTQIEGHTHSFQRSSEEQHRAAHLRPDEVSWGQKVQPLPLGGSPTSLVD